MEKQVFEKVILQHEAITMNFKPKDKPLKIIVYEMDDEQIKEELKKCIVQNQTK